MMFEEKRKVKNRFGANFQSRNRRAHAWKLMNHITGIAMVTKRKKEETGTQATSPRI